MDADTYPLTCSLCGGTGMGAVRKPKANWEPDGRFIHVDPNVCASILVNV